MRRAGRRGQGHQRERPLAGVEFGRDVVVRARVGEHDRQRALRIAAHANRNPGGAPRRRSAPVRADDQRGGEDAAVGERRPWRARARNRTRRRWPRRERDRVERPPPLRARRRAPRSRRSSRTTSRPISRGAEFDRRRREQRAGVVDDPQAAHRRGARRDGRPDAELVEKIDRRAEQRDRPSLAEPLGRAGSRSRERPARAKPIAAARPASPAPTTKTSQVSPASIGEGAIALSWHACFLAVQPARPVAGGGGRGRIGMTSARKAMPVRRVAGVLGPCLHRVRRRRRAARARRGDRARFRRSASPGSAWRCSSTASTARWRASPRSARRRRRSTAPSSTWWSISSPMFWCRWWRCGAPT